MNPLRRLVNTVTNRINHQPAQENHSSGSQGALGGRPVNNLAGQNVISKYAEKTNRIANLQEKISKIKAPGNDYLDAGFDASKVSLGEAKKEIKRLRFTIAFNKKDRKQLKEARKALKEVKAAMCEIKQLKSEQKSIEGEFSKIDKSSSIEVLKYQLSLGASKGPVIVNVNKVSSDELFDLVKDLEKDDALLKAGQKSMEHCEGESQARDAKLVVTGALNSDNVSAVRQLAEQLMTNPKGGKLVSVAEASIPEGEDGKKVLEQLATGGKAIELDKSTTEKPSHVITVSCSPEQLKQLDDLEIENHDSSMETPQTVADLTAKNDERMTKFKFAEAKEGEFERAKGQTSESVADKRITVESQDSDSITSDEDKKLGSFSKDFKTVGDFKVQANGMVNRGSGGKKKVCEDFLVLNSFTMNVGGTESKCIVPAAIDGHGGHQAAEFIQKNLINELQGQLEQLDEVSLEEPQGRQQVSSAIKKAFQELQTSYKAQATKDDKSGADICCPVIVGGYIFTATLGDCRALLVSAESSEQSAFLTPDTAIEHEEFAMEAAMRGHKLTTKDEQGTLEWRAAVIHEDTPNAIPTPRSIGDKNFNTSPIPHVTCTKIPEEGCVLLTTTDGMTDIASGQAMATYLHKAALKNGRGPEVVNEGLQQKAANIVKLGDDRATVVTVLKPASHADR